MKELLCQKVAQLGAAQECLVDMADRIEHWEYSQFVLEKSAFTAINTSDKILNLSMKGTSLVKDIHKEWDALTAEALALRLKELQLLFEHILGQAMEANEIAHKLELEVALQREIGEDMQSKLGTVGESLDAAVACAEFILADL